MTSSTTIYFHRAKPDEVVVILKAREPAPTMTAVGDYEIDFHTIAAMPQAANESQRGQ